MAKMNEVKVPVDVTFNIDIQAAGPVDGRHVIVLPDTVDDDLREHIIIAVAEHFTAVWRHHHPDEPVDAAVAAPFVMFGGDVFRAADPVTPKEQS